MYVWMLQVLYMIYIRFPRLLKVRQLPLHPLVALLETQQMVSDENNMEFVFTIHIHWSMYCRTHKQVVRQKWVMGNRDLSKLPSPIQVHSFEVPLYHTGLHCSTVASAFIYPPKLHFLNATLPQCMETENNSEVLMG